LQRLTAAIERLPSVALHGRVAGVVGLVVEIEGLECCLAIGDRCRLWPRRGEPVMVEVIGLRDDRVLAMPLGALAGVGLGCRADVVPGGHALFPDERWLGRTIDALGEAADGLGPLPQGCDPYPLRGVPPLAATRRRVGGKLDLGVRAVNVFATCCRGQRMGIVSGSGVGKSTLLAMMARNADADVNVIGLVGERGREAREFVEDHLGEAGRARSVVVVATSDQPPLLRRQAAYATLAVAEYFRDRGRQVLCMMDSVTRFAMAQREIGLSAGEPPATKGYTPSMFAELPRLLERAGPGPAGCGDITGLFTVLVEGDDLNEPVVDAVRGILDGHVVLDRAIAERGRFPAVNVLKSLSRTLPDCNRDDENALVERARRVLALYDDMAELIRLGAYRRGSDPQVDEAVRLFPGLDAFLRQGKTERSSLAEAYAALEAVLDGGATTPVDGAQRPA
jgi:flagellum-specific ATP synthase